MLSKNHLSKLALAVLMGLSSSAAIAEITEYSAVTQERLNNPESENWLMWRGNYSGWGYSPLNEITSDNVGNLKLAPGPFPPVLLKVIRPRLSLITALCMRLHR